MLFSLPSQTSDSRHPHIAMEALKQITVTRELNLNLNLILLELINFKLKYPHVASSKGTDTYHLFNPNHGSWKQQSNIFKGLKRGARTGYLAKVTFKNDNEIELFANKNRDHHQETSLNETQK